ncbi:hypothetical protein CDL12_26767 [Olea europaea subsp. europaea]|uniref:Uncharacterized protein n=1 Tax=Olea europaea subsp. europaea TaxID=158383 RepID=A0A8S0U9I1_OLEEU|nr:hypothetical protein CDL12_26767 [Olea europaea subsp. europaea]
MCVFFYFNLYLGQGNTKWSPVLNPYSVFSKFFASLNLLAMDVNESSMNFSFPVRGNSWLQDLLSVFSFHCRPIDSPSEKRDAVSTPVNKPLVLEAQTSTIDIRIQQARNFAVAQAQQDGCTGNFRMFDSPYGNYLVPVIPTLADLGE